MSVEIGSLGADTLGTDLSALYTADGKTAVVKNIIFSNKDAATTTTIEIYFTPSGGSDFLIMPKALAIPPGFTVIHDAEITLSDGDAIRGKASNADDIDFVVSGIEREVV